MRSRPAPIAGAWRWRRTCVPPHRAAATGVLLTAHAIAQVLFVDDESHGRLAATSVLRSMIRAADLL